MQALQAGDPDRVGRYRLVGRLGEGGMGQVFLGRSAGGRPVAVKLVRPEYGVDAAFRKRFAREVAAARQVGGFFTAQVVDADPHAERPWLVSAYVPGPALHTAVSTHGPLPVSALRVLAAGLAEGLAAVHDCGLVHRDLKPANVILAADGPRIIDFGIAHALEATSLTVTGIIAGTPAFMAPEQARGERDITPAADVFALGSVLAFAATGETPFGSGLPAAVLYRIVQEEPDLAPLSRVDAALHDLVADCLAKDPSARPATAELLDDFAALAGPDGSTDTWLPQAVTTMIGDFEVTTGELRSRSGAYGPGDDDGPDGRADAADDREHDQDGRGHDRNDRGDGRDGQEDDGRDGRDDRGGDHQEDGGGVPDRRVADIPETIVESAGPAPRTRRRGIGRFLPGRSRGAAASMVTDPHAVTRGWNGLPWGAMVSDFRTRFPQASQQNGEWWVTGRGPESFCGLVMDAQYGFNDQGRLYLVVFYPEVKDRERLSVAALETFGAPDGQTTRWTRGKVVVEVKIAGIVASLTHTGFDTDG